MLRQSIRAVISSWESFGRMALHAKSVSTSVTVRAFASAGIDKPSSIWCVGRNYEEHIKELGNSGEKAEDPMIFLKAGSSAIPSGAKIILPHWSKDVHHEIELAIKLGEDLQPIQAAASLDLTLRDVQSKLKKAQHPWALSKSFPCSAPVGDYFDVKGHDLQNLELVLTVNGRVRQSSNTNLMIFKVPRLLEYIKSRFPVVPGDLILTGTPHGVSALQHGDDVVAKVMTPDGAVLSEGKWSVVRD